MHIGKSKQANWASLGGSVIKNPFVNVGNTGLIPELGRSSGEGNGNPFQYSCLGNSMGEEPDGL